MCMCSVCYGFEELTRKWGLQRIPSSREKRRELRIPIIRDLRMKQLLMLSNGVIWERKLVGKPIYDRVNHTFTLEV